MKVQLIGLGKMGFNLAMNMMSQGIEVTGYDADERTRFLANEAGIKVVGSIPELMAMNPGSSIVWVMVPSGNITHDVLSVLAESGKPGDIVLDGGNSNYKESKKHAEMFAQAGMSFLDVGTSGGMSGARRGACLMVGGNLETFNHCLPLFESVSCLDGCLYAGPSGSGHFLKMVHNGIEYGMMQAIGEGFEVLEASEYDFDFEAVAKNWNHGSVIRGWLMELAQEAFDEDARLDGILGEVDASGEAQWTLEEALMTQVPTPVIALSLMMRYRSKQDDSYSGKVVAALRKGFGGHAVKKAGN